LSHRIRTVETRGVDPSGDPRMAQTAIVCQESRIRALNRTARARAVRRKANLTTRYKDFEASLDGVIAAGMVERRRSNVGSRLMLEGCALREVKLGGGRSKPGIGLQTAVQDLPERLKVGSGDDFLNSCQIVHQTLPSLGKIRSP